MAVIKIAHRDYSSDNTYYKNGVDETLIKYITNPNKTLAGFVGGYNVNTYDPDCVIEQFKIVRNIHHKETGRLLRHIIISYSLKENVDGERALKLAYCIAAYYANEFQIVFAIHQSTQHIHIHFVMNTVSLIDGHKFSESLNQFNIFLSFIQGLSTDIKYDIYDDYEYMEYN